MSETSKTSNKDKKNKIDPKEYKVTKCTITDKECLIKRCTGCSTAKEQKAQDQVDEDSTYRFRGGVYTNKGKTYERNGRRTVLMAMVEDLEDMKAEFLPEPQELLLMDSKLLEHDYPEWLETIIVLDIRGDPQKYFYQQGKPLIIVYTQRIYLVMPVSREK